MLPHDLIGQPVRIRVWDDLSDILPAGPNGTITGVSDGRAGALELTVRVMGLERTYVFLIDEVEFVNTPPNSSVSRGA
jgi:hypothetical protein